MHHDDEIRQLQYERNMRKFWGQESGHDDLDEKLAPEIRVLSKMEQRMLEELAAVSDSTCNTLPRVFYAPLPQEDEELPDKEYLPIYRAPYDKARTARDEARARVEIASYDRTSEEHCAAMAALAEAEQRFKVEQFRATDNDWRRRQEIDRYRSENREERNALARKVREVPNKNLSELTEEERQAHERVQTSDYSWCFRARKKGWTEEKIAAGLAERKARRSN
jgi:hypothetical protein